MTWSAGFLSRTFFFLHMYTTTLMEKSGGNLRDPHHRGQERGEGLHGCSGLPQGHEAGEPVHETLAYTIGLSVDFP